MSAQPAAELEAMRCPDCDEVVIGQARYEAGPIVYLAPITNPDHARLVVSRVFRGVMLVRDRLPREQVQCEALARAHECRPHPFECNTPVGRGQDRRPCGRPARLFPGGTWCERHRP